LFIASIAAFKRYFKKILTSFSKMINVSIVTYLTPIEDVHNVLSICCDSLVVKNIFVIDNSPDDRLCKALISDHKVKYIHNPSNLGYGSAHNIALRESLLQNIPFHLVLNADVVFDSKILEQIVSYANRNKDIGLISPKMLYEDGSVQCSRKLLPTPFNMFLRAFLPRSFRTQADDKFQLENLGYDRPLFVPYVSGAFMFFRTSILEKIGLFDERFFMYPEDIDLSRRVAQVSEVRFAPNFVITHKYGGATRKSLRMFVIHFFNMCRYFNKWGWIFDKGRRDLNKFTLEQKSISKLGKD
jgi:GT2 family glycosyltransferase